MPTWRRLRDLPGDERRPGLVERLDAVDRRLRLAPKPVPEATWLSFLATHWQFYVITGGIAVIDGVRIGLRHYWLSAGLLVVGGGLWAGIGATYLRALRRHRRP